MLNKDNYEIMLTYFISQSNGFVVRTENTGSNELSLELENLYTHETSSFNLSGSYSFHEYENILTFTASLDGVVSTGQQYRAIITDTTSSIWRGGIEVFKSQSVDKSVYKTQRDGYISQQTDNDYIVL